MKCIKMTKTNLTLFFLIGVSAIYAQKTFVVQNENTLKISGTSSLHDWDMTSSTASGKMAGIFENQSLQSIQSLSVEMQAESLKSGKSGMDKNAYKALKTSQFKTIKFDLKTAKKEGNIWTLNGTFQIAGVTKNVAIKAKESVNGGGVILEGSYDFKLTDYDITPPTALMGTVKTGDAVKLIFKILFKPL